MRIVTQLIPRGVASLPLLLTLTAPCARAQWSDNVGVNLVVAAPSPGSFDFAVAPTADRGFWAAWASESPGGLDIYAQRFDAAGYAAFGTQGIVALDLDELFLLALDGVVTSDGEFVLCTHGEQGTRLQRITVDGIPLWGPDGVSPSVQQMDASLVPLGTDVVFVGSDYVSQAPNAQRFDRTGAEVWGAWVHMPEFIMPLRISKDSDPDGVLIAGVIATAHPGGFGVGLQRINAQGGRPWGPIARLITFDAPIAWYSWNQPAVRATGDGGAVVTWSLERAPSLPDLLLQRVDASGSTVLGPYGVPLAPSVALRNSSGIEYDEVSDEAVVAWAERDLVFPPSTTPVTMRLQRFDVQGAPRFAPEGIELAALGTTATSDVVDLALGAVDPSGAGRSAFVSWSRIALEELTGAVVDPAGATGPGPVTLSSALSERGQLRTLASRSGEAQGQVLWIERDASGFLTLLGQNFRADGSLGPGTLGDTTCDGGVNSTGARGTLRAMGSAVVARDILSLRATDLPPHELGTFLFSPIAGFSPNPGGSPGDLCLGRPIGRGAIRVVDTAGRIDERVDLTQVPSPTGATPVLAGETWQFQGWYRDVNGQGNFTEGLSVRFL